MAYAEASGSVPVLLHGNLDAVLNGTGWREALGDFYRLKPTPAFYIQKWLP